MHIFVINLTKDKARRESIQRQFDQLQLPFEFFPGVLGTELSKEELSHCYDDKKARRNLCMPLVRAQIGCALSHTNVYREIVKLNLPHALILEDDVVLPPTLPRFLSEIQWVISSQRPEVLLLSQAEGFRGKQHKRTINNERAIVPFRSGYFASSYVVTNAAARTLLKQLYPIGDVADCWSRLKRYKVVDIYVLTPHLICQDQQRFGSSTTLDLKKHLKNGFSFRLAFKMKRFYAETLDVLYGYYRRKCLPYCGVRIDSHLDHDCSE